MTAIYVTDNDGAIGKGGDLLCRLPADMKHFRETTLNSTVIMGRKTYLSFPKRPLVNRENIVLSRSAGELDGARVFGDVDSALDYVKTVNNKVFVIGGGEVYRELMPYCGEAIVTRVYENFGGDVFLDDIACDKNWELLEASSVFVTECRKIRFFRYKRIK